MRIPSACLLALLALAPASAARAAQRASPAPHAGLLPVDAFHPDHQPDARGVRPALPEPGYGGRAIVHVESMPPSLCWTIENSGVARRILYEVHETLLLRDWETHAFVPNLCASYTIDDTLVLAGGRGADDANVRIGEVEETADGYVLRERGSSERVTFARDAVESLQRGTVFTFELRPNVRWHDGHVLDAADVLFSWKLYANPAVRCDDKRGQFTKIVSARVLDPLTIRFCFEQQYFLAESSIGEMCILPAHLYDLSDPDNARADPEYHARRKREDPHWTPSAADQAEYVLTNAHNQGGWVGLGPYRIARWDAEAIEAVRFDDYFDPARGGYLDTIRWRHVPKGPSLLQALLNGELDYFGSLTSDEYFGAACADKAFTERLYKGNVTIAAYWYNAWNMLRPQFEDVNVRRALALCFDFDAFKRSFYNGLADQVTGPWPYGSAAYAGDVEPLPYAPEQARTLLTEAGWYDRNGDGTIDKDGIEFEIEMLTLLGNPTSEQFGIKYQEDLARLGIELDVVPLEIATILERRRNREFDAVNMAWVLPPESDPEGTWHSSLGAPGQRGSNFSGVQDAQVDALIARGQRELDPEKRAAIWRALHARIYELQPYLFGYCPPRKFAVSRALRGVQAVLLDPNYVIRRWYHPLGTPGTRATRAAATQPAK